MKKIIAGYLNDISFNNEFSISGNIKTGCLELNMNNKPFASLINLTLNLTKTHSPSTTIANILSQCCYRFANQQEALRKSKKQEQPFPQLFPQNDKKMFYIGFNNLSVSSRITKNRTINSCSGHSFIQLIESETRNTIQLGRWNWFTDNKKNSPELDTERDSLLFVYDKKTKTTTFTKIDGIESKTQPGCQCTIQ
ncbi:hypothetical protein DID75_03015 [Candidatus Marinamargulisbacteria bacterium SCGC AG-410-N11]|nr:hypothetical protein DID75_03015 [Candidatus Marinamargulisbacteria bacterium SCGC AG-410-N11]